jgi:hypothetical protein
LAQQKKAKVGRPRMPKGEAKGRIVPVRFRGDDLKVLETAAKTSDQTVSDWIRNMVNTHFNAYCPKCMVNVTASIAMSRDALVKALQWDTDVPLIHAFPLAPDHKFPATGPQKELMRKRIANGTF